MRMCTILLVCLLFASSAAARRGGNSAPTPNVVALGKGDDDSRVTNIKINSPLVPRRVLQEAAQRSGILAPKPDPDAPTRLAAHIDYWYKRNGFIFARVASRGPPAGRGRS